MNMKLKRRVLLRERYIGGAYVTLDIKENLFLVRDLGIKRKLTVVRCNRLRLYTHLCAKIQANQIFVTWRLAFLVLQNGTCFILPFWLPEF